jgi:hypothetical protein
MTASNTRQQAKAIKANTYNNVVNFVLNSKETVKIADLYELMGNVTFKTVNYFVRTMTVMSENDSRIVFRSVKKKGTFAAAAAVEMIVPENAVVVKKSHKTAKATKANVYNNMINFILNSKETVKIADLYELMGNATFNSVQYFSRSFIDMAKNDSRIQLHTAKKKGTFAAAAGLELIIPVNKVTPKKLRKVQMGGYFGIAKFTMTGRPVTIEIDEDVWNLCKKTPKAFSGTEVVEVYSMDIEGQPAQYLQITNNRQFHFTVNA